MDGLEDQNDIEPCFPSAGPAKKSSPRCVNAPAVVNDANAGPSSETQSGSVSIDPNAGPSGRVPSIKLETAPVPGTLSGLQHVPVQTPSVARNINKRYESLAKPIDAGNSMSQPLKVGKVISIIEVCCFFSFFIIENLNHFQKRSLPPPTKAPQTKKRNLTKKTTQSQNEAPKPSDDQATQNWKVFNKTLSKCNVNYKMRRTKG